MVALGKENDFYVAGKIRRFKNSQICKRKVSRLGTSRIVVTDLTSSAQPTNFNSCYDGLASLNLEKSVTNLSQKRGGYPIVLILVMLDEPLELHGTRLFKIGEKHVSVLIPCCNGLVLNHQDWREFCHQQSARSHSNKQNSAS